MEFEFSARVIEWRGPAPFYYADIPVEDSDDVKDAAKGLEYWGQVPVVALIGDTEFTTALFPKDGRYLLPLKDVVRRAEGIELGMTLEVGMDLRRSAPRTG
ncbi:DUF1905 domain-containing protein [Nocardioides stalactiti]|uniref:DUF1905 domain-containing protein n=1 Tax=Nocardioides stalactiti TaxID=2755356 RepID=UPI0015FF6029|nr:DUF1905 domain-containing protein [Nocardioides stalactiti]